MIVDSVINPQTLIRPGSFAALMTLYESNFIRLGQLVPSLRTFKGSVVSVVPGDCDLEIALRERTRYTTVLSMNYLFRDEGELSYSPNLVLKAYFDGRLAEVLEIDMVRVGQIVGKASASFASELDSRWSRNIMLNKWLEYCYECGHRFD